MSSGCGGPYLGTYHGTILHMGSVYSTSNIMHGKHCRYNPDKMSMSMTTQGTFRPHPGSIHSLQFDLHLPPIDRCPDDKPSETAYKQRS